MARLISSSDSLPRHLEMARRHMRKCSKTPGTANYADIIKPFFEKLKNIQTRVEKAEESVQDGYDDLDLGDTLLDDTVRNLFDITTIYDRSNTGMPILQRIFPQGKYGYIVNSPISVEIDEVKKIIDRLKESDSNGEFTEFVSKLTERYEEIENLLNSQKTKINDLKAIKSETDIIKSDLRWQYEVNYLDARKQLGRKRAELLFPEYRRTSKSTNIEDL